MPNTKKFVAYDTTAKTVYGIIERQVDSYRLDDANGAFTAAPADPYVSFTEHTVIKGEYVLSESRTAWNDGLYKCTMYEQAGGSPAPVSDIVIAYQYMQIGSDTEVDLGPADLANINTEVDTAVEFIISCIKNKKYLVKESSVWYLVIRNTADDANIVKKALKDKDSSNITDISAGILAQELLTSV